MFYCSLPFLFSPIPINENHTLCIIYNFAVQIFINQNFIIMVKILSIKWSEQGNETILVGAKIIEVSEASSNLNLKVSKGSIYPRYAPLSDIEKYMKEKPQELIAPEPAPAPEPIIEEVKAEPAKAAKPAKEEKPIFKTVEEKQAYEAAQKAKA